MSRSRSSTDNTQISETHVQNLNVQDTEGITIANSSGVQVTATDYGAVQGALDVGLEALRLGSDNLSTAADLAGRGLDTAIEATQGALSYGEGITRAALDTVGISARDAIREVADFGSVALREVSASGRDSLREALGFGETALDSVTGAQEGVLDFARDIFSGALDAFGVALDAQSDLTGQNISGLTALARQTSESADDRVTRTAGYAFVAIAVVMLAMMWRRA